MPAFQVLPGLPPYGALPEQFSARGMGKHREGLVVEFTPEGEPGWVGNFQRGLTSFDGVFTEPGTQLFVVVAGGQGYVVDTRNRECLRTLGGQIEQVWCPSAEMLVFSNGFEMEAIGPSGFGWRSRRISWDGFQSLRLEGGQILGEAWNAVNRCWAPFTVDLRTGEVEGGPYPLPPSRT